MAPTPTQTVSKNLVLRNVVQAQISEIFNSSVAARQDPTQLNHFFVRFETLAPLYAEFKEYHKLILPHLTTETDLDAHDDARKQVDTMYFSIQVAYKELVASSPEPDCRSLTPGISERSNNVKLPRISLPHFDGTKLSEWPTFLDLFNSLIHNNKSLSLIEKFHYLITSLSQEPLNLVKSISMTNENYSVAYDTLVKRYQNKRLLATSYWNALHDIVPLSSDSQNSLRHLHDTFSENTLALKALKFPVDSWDFPLFNICLSKLDPVTRKQFELDFSQTEVPTFQNLLDFLEERSRALETFSSKPPSRGFQKEVKHPRPRLSPQASSSFVARVTNADISRSIVPTCRICKAQHYVTTCSLFLSKSPSERFQMAKNNKLCINCLKPGHISSQCRSGTCRTCRRPHHTLLHFRSASNDSSTQAAPQQNTVSVSSLAVGENSLSPTVPSAFTSTVETIATVLLSTAVVDVLDRWGNFQSIRVLLDGGSQANFISQHAAHRLGLKITAHSVPIQGLNSSNSISQGLTTCILKPRGQTDPQLTIHSLVLPQICGNMPSVPINCRDWSHVQNLKLADPSFANPAHIDMLLGAEFFPIILMPGILSSSPEKPIAINTIFGWILMGKVSTQQQQSSISSFHASIETSLPQVLQQFWELEQVSSQHFVSPEDELVEETFRTKHYRNSTGRFVVPLLLKSKKPTFVDSYSIALRRFLALERRFAQNSELHNSYLNFMKDYVDSDHMELLNLSSEEVNRPDSYYIPHHAVFKTENCTSKIRVVYNASSSDAEGRSLNNSVFVGPKLQTDISNILLRFRFHSLVFTADIRQMYRQILVRPEERKYQRILWRFSSSDPIQVYQLNTVTYGISSSPFLAIRCIRQLAEDNKAEFPLASNVLLVDTYIDDLVTGCNNLEEAKLLREQLLTVMSQAQLELRKWSSNNPQFLEDVPLKFQQIQTLTFENDSSSTLKVLGLQWHPMSDNFSYEVTPWERPCTKRNILSELARIFDPLGFLTPLTFLAKHLIQCLWTCKADWDDTPPPEIVKRWNRYKTELPSLSYLQIPRRLLVDNLESCQLLGFCDASSIGYSSVVYFRTLNTDGQVHTFLVCAKSKVAPLKTLSIPRLELCAAALLADLISIVVTTFNGLLTFDRISAWSDSSVALSWIHSSPHRWKPFVSNRVAHIQEKLPSSHWHHVHSRDNPADCASRGLFPIELLNHSQWWHGPDWIRDSPARWPSTAVRALENPSDMPLVCQEERKVVLTATIPFELFTGLLDRYSSLPKIQRIVAYCIRFIHNLKNPQSKIVGPLTAEELSQSLNLLVRHVQQSVFADDIHKIQNNQPVSKALRKLNPFVDSQGILRVGGRIRHSDLTFEAKHPALLPRCHRLTDLIVEDTHQRFLHPGPKTLHFLLRQNFWILSARRAIHSCLAKCFRCFRIKPSSSFAPLMGDLPSFRISQVKPFAHVGIDFAGPFKITMGKHRGAKTTKAYLCLIVCMATKALHLELVSDLTSEACLAALRRFIARRGHCLHIYSDCGTNFVGASKVLIGLFQNSASRETIAWTFNPPSAPHFGGLWEAGVKSVKSHLYRVIGDQILTYEELQTVFIQIEALLNSRPLCEISSDPNDLSSLTPGHFLTLAPLSAIPNPNLSHLKLNRLSRWQLLQRLHGDFWKRWHLEYLHTLQQRQKWTAHSSPPSLGTLVVIKDETTPPMHWRLGRIIELVTGKDGIPRVANVKTANGLIKRPLVKLCPLPTS